MAIHSSVTMTFEKSLLPTSVFVGPSLLASGLVFCRGCEALSKGRSFPIDTSDMEEIHVVFLRARSQRTPLPVAAPWVSRSFVSVCCLCASST
eukprot:scaffold6037_cov166-Pinguiococcus_pyrenoidosus.AAC.1